MEKPKHYRIHFVIDVYCCGVISYANGHTSVLAYSEEEARMKVKDNLQLKYGHTSRIELLTDFNSPIRVPSEYQFDEHEDDEDELDEL